MVLTKATPLPPASMIQAIVQSAWNITKEEATYTIRFGGKSPRSVTAPSAVGARELYTQAASRGFAFPFEQVDAKDSIVGDVWITDVTWKAHDVNTGYDWTFTTRGAEPYDKANDTLAVANRKAWGKAERNACLRCVPRPIVIGFLSYLSHQTGVSVVEDAGNPDEPTAITATPETPTPARLATKPTNLGKCKEHNKQWADTPNGIGHPAPGVGKWCLKMEHAHERGLRFDAQAMDADKAEAAPIPEASLDKLLALTATLEDLKSAVTEQGWQWDEFEDQVINTTWEEWAALSGDGSVELAWKRFQRYQNGQEE